MSLVDKFCFCGSLKTGGVIIGVLGIVFNVLIIKGSAILLIVANQMYKDEKLPEDATPFEEDLYHQICSRLMGLIRLQI